jgi:membrane fusion protein (multidrug efflux system)
MSVRHTIASRLQQIGAGRMRVFLIVGLLAVAAIGWAWWHYSGRESTDDAQIDAHITQIAARVGGTVRQVHVRDNQAVDAGTVLVEIDPRDYQIAVQHADAELAAARAAAEAARVNVPIARTESTSGVTAAQGGVAQADAARLAAEREIASAHARLASAEATARQRQAEANRATKDVERLKTLIAKDEISQQQYDAAASAAEAATASADAARAAVKEAHAAVDVAESRAKQAEAALDQAQASYRAARTAPEQIQATRANAEAAAARVQQAQAALAQAQLNLEHATVRAPTAGVVSRKTVEVGQVIQPGQPLLALVDLDHLWVTANFKETQLGDVRVGQRVRVEVDAIDGKTFTGHVDSVAAATGARFSLLPPENATGNYVKVVQRVPVKILFDPGQDPQRQLRPGMSVVPTVFVR